jgi:hypothetical protein
MPISNTGSKPGEAVRIENYLERFPQLAADPQTLLELIKAEYQWRRLQGPPPDLAE